VIWSMMGTSSTHRLIESPLLTIQIKSPCWQNLPLL
jgi:hypothetical protein